MTSINELRSENVRQNTRVKDRCRLYWHLQDSDIKGRGRVCNISTSGMLLETNGLFVPNNQNRFTFTTNLGIDNYIPKFGEIVWHRKKKDKKNGYLCGVKFVEPAGFVLSKLQRKIDHGLKKAKVMEVTETTSNALIAGGIIALAAIVVWLAAGIYQDMTVTNHSLIKSSNQQAVITQTYIGQLKETQLQLNSALDELASTRILYQESQSALGDITKELESTKAILAQTEALLVQARQGAIDSQILNERELLKTKAELMNTIVILEQKNVQLAGEMNVINSKLQYYEGNINNLDEGKLLIKEYRTKLRKVKRKVNHFRKEAKLTRIAALKERDRIRLILGNNGFFMKDGRSVRVDEQRYQDGILYSATQGAGKGNVNIDVKIVD